MMLCQKHKSEFSSKKYSYEMEIMGSKTLIKLLSITGFLNLKILLSPCPNSLNHFSNTIRISDRTFVRCLFKCITQIL